MYQDGATSREIGKLHCLNEANSNFSEFSERDSLWTSVDKPVKMRSLRFVSFPEMGGVHVMVISTNIHDDAPLDEDQYKRVHGRYRQSQDYQQGQDYHLQHQDDEALPIVSTNDWWRLLLPNPWLEVRRL
jgi:hypothetical protein